MRRLGIMLVLLMLVINLFPQTFDTLSLKYSYKLATENYPLVKQRELLTEASKFKTSNIKSSFYPQMFLNGQASYQSEVTSLPIVIPNTKIPSLYKDQYKAVVDINQLIYDGGINKKQQLLEERSLASDKQNLEVELYKIKDRINQLFFNIQILQNNAKILELQKSNIKENVKKIESGIKNGVNYQASADVMIAEILKIEEQIIEINAGRDAAFQMLSELIGKEVKDNTNLILSETENVKINMENKRPELDFFDQQANLLDANKNLLTAQRNPRISGFGEAGYGRPGYNFLSNKFDSFYQIGAKFSWNIWDWNQVNNQKKLLDIQKNMITAQKETFYKNIKISTKTDMANINKYNELIKKDEEVIKLRENIVKTSESQLENKIITTTDYITELNALTQAKVNLESHKLQLIFARINYLNNMGQ